MSEFTEKWAKLSKHQRRQVRRDMRTQALKRAQARLGLFSTNAQLKASARTMIDMAMGAARRGA